MTVCGHGRQRGEAHKIRALGHNAFADLNALDDLHEITRSRLEVSRGAARTFRLRAARTQSDVPHRPRWRQGHDWPGAVLSISK